MSRAYHSTTYLDQIASKPARSSAGKLNFKTVGIIGGGLVLLVIIISVIAGTISANRQAPVQHLTARLATLEVIATDAQSNLKSSQLRSLNSSLRLFLTNTNRDIVAPLAAIGIDPKKLPASITQAESPEGVATRLDDARLNGTFDATYTREMEYLLSVTVTLAGQVASTTSRTDLKSLLATTQDSLRSIQESLAAN